MVEQPQDSPSRVNAPRFRRSGVDRIGIIIILVGILIRLPLVFTPFNAMGYPWRESDTDSIARNFAEQGYHLLYPQINWGGAGPGYVEAEFQLYPFIVALLYGIFGEFYWIGRLVSLAFTIAAFFLFYGLARRNLSLRAAQWALAFFVIAPMYIRFSVEFMPEATVLCFYLAALYCFQRWLDEQKRSLFLIAALCTAFAILVKPTSIHIGLIFLFLLLQCYGWRAFIRPSVWLFCLISLLPGAVWYWHAHNLYIEYGNTFGVLSGGDSKFGNIVGYWLSWRFYLSTALIDVTWILANAGVIVFALGAAVFVRTRQPALLLFGTVAVGIYYMLLPRYTSSVDMGLHYHIFFVPFAAVGVGLGFSWLFEQIKTRLSVSALIHNIPALAGLALIALILFFSARYYRRLFDLNGETAIACAQQVATRVPPSDRIIVSSDSAALDNGVANNYQDPVIFYVSRHFGWSLASDQQTPTLLEQFRQAGATYFVMYDTKAYDANRSLASYLQSNAEQVGPGIDVQCGIYKFNPLTSLTSPF